MKHPVNANIKSFPDDLDPSVEQVEGVDDLGPGLHLSLPLKDFTLMLLTIRYVFRCGDISLPELFPHSFRAYIRHTCSMVPYLSSSLWVLHKIFSEAAS